MKVTGRVLRDDSKEQENRTNRRECNGEWREKKEGNELWMASLSLNRGCHGNWRFSTRAR